MMGTKYFKLNTIFGEKLNGYVLKRRKLIRAKQLLIFLVK